MSCGLPTSVSLGHGHLSRPIDPNDVATWSDLSICYPGHELLYRFRDDIARLLYVGVTWNPKERWKRHRKTKFWWFDVCTVDVECYDSDPLAFAAEWHAIKTESPMYNIHGAVRLG